MGSWTGQWEEHVRHSARRPRCGFLRLNFVREGCAVRRTGVVPSGDKEEGAIALLTHHAKGWDPCGFYRRSCLSALTDHINQGAFVSALASATSRATPALARCPNAF